MGVQSEAITDKWHDNENVAFICETPAARVGSSSVCDDVKKNPALR